MLSNCGMHGMYPTMCMYARVHCCPPLTNEALASAVVEILVVY